MANTKYDQVMDLLAEGKLNWRVNDIRASLVQGTTFDAADTKLSDVGGAVYSTAIQGRTVATGGKLLGFPAIYQAIQPGEYQLVVHQYIPALGPDQVVLAYYDTDGAGDPLVLEAPGTLFVRPVLVGVPGNAPAGSGIWMTL